MMELLAALSGACIVVGLMIKRSRRARRPGPLDLQQHWVGLACCAIFMALAGERSRRPGFRASHVPRRAGRWRGDALLAGGAEGLHAPADAGGVRQPDGYSAGAGWAFSGSFSAPRAAGSLLVLAGLVVLGPSGDASVT